MPAEPAVPAVLAVSPWVVATDAAALLDFLTEAFGAQEVGRAPGPGGAVGHAETVLGGTTLVVVDALDGWAAPPVLLRLHVDDVVSVVTRAVTAGARVVTPPTLLPQGAAVARVADAWGNLWWLEQQVEQVEVEDLLARLSDPATLEAVAAHEASLDAELRARAPTA